MIHRNFTLSVLAIALLLSACSRSAASGLFSAQTTPTPTPFLPNMPARGGQQVVWAEQGNAEEIVEHFLPPSAPSDIAIPAPLGSLPQPEGQVNILLMGSDKRPNDGGFRTDVVLLLTLNPEGNRVSLTSFPRDLYVYEPGWRMDRINNAQQRGGFTMMADTLDYNFGVRPDHYVLVNFDGFTQLIDALGGITVNVGQPLTDEREGPGNFSVPAGNVTMDGATALWYVRSRGNSNDFLRNQRQQEVITAIFFRLISLDAISKAAQLYEQYKQVVTTDIGVADILPFLPLAATISGNGEIHRYAIGSSEVDPYTTSSGGSVLVPKRDAVRAVMVQALSSPQ